MPSEPKAIEKAPDHGANGTSYLTELDAETNETKKTELLFSWLCDDRHRPALYAELRQNRPVLRVASCAPPSASGPASSRWVYLITDTETIRKALSTFSNSVYRGIGTGSFVLGMDISPQHAAKRTSLIESLKIDPRQLHTIAVLSCHHALVGPLKTDNFDLVTDIAEQAAVRFIAAYFGFPDSDHVLLQEALRRGFDGMILQMFARHFVTELALPTISKTAMGMLTDRIAVLLREASTTPLRTRIFDWLNSHPQTAPGALRTLADDVGSLDGQVSSHANEFITAIGAPGLAQRTAEFLDFTLNHGRVRRGMQNALAKLPSELRDDLAAIVDDLIARKTAPDGHLVPRRWLTNGTLPKWDDKDGDYHFRQTIIEKLARNPGNSSPLELAVDVIGLIAGLIGNVIAGTCVAIDRYFRLDDQNFAAQVQGRAKAFSPPAQDASPEAVENALREAIGSATLLQPFVAESMRLQPPAAFLPRTTLQDAQLQFDSRDLPAGTEVIVPLGAATRDFAGGADGFDEAHGSQTVAKYILGDPNGGPESHRCIGGHVALPLIAHVVRSVLALPGLARQQIDGRPAELKKKWGYICESFALRYDRDLRIVQRPLNVVMNIKQPAGEHAAKLELLIKYGAPAIEELLRRSGIVHFARFAFLNGDTQLALMTTYDGDFDHYMRHFAQAAGPLFDMIFEHIEDPPPMPVSEHPTEFVEHIARFDVPPAADYFFAAHPTRRVT